MEKYCFLFGICLQLNLLLYQVFPTISPKSTLVLTKGRLMQAEETCLSLFAVRQAALMTTKFPLFTSSFTFNSYGQFCYLFRVLEGSRNATVWKEQVNSVTVECGILVEAFDVQSEIEIMFDEIPFAVLRLVRLTRKFPLCLS